MKKRIGYWLAAILAVTPMLDMAAAEETPPADSAEKHEKAIPADQRAASDRDDGIKRELTYREYPTDQRGSESREFWPKSTGKFDEFKSRDADVAQPNLALQEGARQATSNGDQVDNLNRVSKDRPIEGGAEQEATDSAEKRVPQTLRHHDRDTQGAEDRDTSKR